VDGQCNKTFHTDFKLFKDLKKFMTTHLTVKEKEKEKILKKQTTMVVTIKVVCA